MRIVLQVVGICGLALFAGCLHQSAETPKPAVIAKGKSLVVVGDETAESLKSRMESKGIRVFTDFNSDGERQLVVIVQDAMTGAMPVHGDLVEQAAKQKATIVLWVMTNTDKVDDLELLELEELEARELLTKHGFPGDEIQFAFDSEKALTRPPYKPLKGLDAIVDSFAVEKDYGGTR